jgi:site-specific DNA recombinase
MKKAIIYARVSSDLQKKEGTIESQILELKKQVTTNGDVLVDEYIDEGFSGALLDRPAMNRLREDLKVKDKFEIIYFLNTDRIAREVTYQTIIISEILKNKKQIIINGRDYVNDPENKFTLTVLGAVAELERAKITERTGRGRQLKIRQGVIMAPGCKIFGYNHHKKTDSFPAYYTINEKEAEVVRIMYSKYLEGKMGLGGISRYLEENGHAKKMGSQNWYLTQVKKMLKQEMYMGIRYYNKLKTETDSKGRYRMVKRPREEWVGVKVPAIISEEDFNKVQEKFKWNKEKYRNPYSTQLLSNLTYCGYCNYKGFAYRRYYRDTRYEVSKLFILEFYKCHYRERFRKMYPKNTGRQKCPNKDMRAYILEDHVFKMMYDYMRDPEILSNHMDFFKRKARKELDKVVEEISILEQKIEKEIQTKKQLLTKYVDQDISSQDYSTKSLELDQHIQLLKLKKQELIQNTPLLHKKDVVENAVKQYSQYISTTLPTLTDFDSKREFLLKNISKVIFQLEKVEIQGFVPISDEIKLPFSITENIPRSVRDVSGNVVKCSGERINLSEYVKLERQNKQTM